MQKNIIPLSKSITPERIENNFEVDDFVINFRLGRLWITFK